LNQNKKTKFFKLGDYNKIIWQLLMICNYLENIEKLLILKTILFYKINQLMAYGYNFLHLED